MAAITLNLHSVVVRTIMVQNNTIATKKANCKRNAIAHVFHNLECKPNATNWVLELNNYKAS